MPRTDENGRQLRVLLDYLLDGQLTTKQMHEALGISSSSYHRRVRDDDYPNADELHKIATRFHLSFTDLQVRLRNRDSRGPGVLMSDLGKLHRLPRKCRP